RYARIVAGKAARIAMPVEHPLACMPLLARHRTVRLQPALDDRDERIKLCPPDLVRPSVARWHREGHHLRNRVTRDVEHPRRFPLAHAFRASLANSQRSEEHTSELQSRENLVCRLLLEKKNKIQLPHPPLDARRAAQ